MKVLMVASIARHFLAFHLPCIRLLQGMGYEVHVACNPNGDGEALARQGVKVWPLPLERSPWRLAANLAAFRRLLDIMRAGRYRLVHVHTPVAAFLGRLAARLAGVPAVLYTAHGFHFYRNAPLLNWFLYYPMEWLAARWTDGLLAINEEDYRRARRLPVRGEVYRVPGVGVPLPPVPSSPEGMTALVAGELSGTKNVGHVLRAWKLVSEQLPGAVLQVVGDGSCRASLERLAVTLGIAPAVRFLGFRHDLPTLLARATVVVSASRREGLPRVIMEAMAAGRPVVASDVRGHRDLLVHGQTGYLVPLRDPRAMAEAILAVLRDPSLARRLGEQARRRAEDFAVERVLGVMEEVYRRWLGLGDDKVKR